MRNARRLALAAALLGAVPTLAAADASAEAPWSIAFGVWAGRSRYDVLGLKSNVSGAVAQGAGVLDGGVNMRGAQVLLRLGWLDVGALVEGTVPRTGADSLVVTPVAGFKWDLSDFWRLDFLGELGGHQVSNIGQGGSFDAAQVKSVWLPSAGFRVGVSARVPAGPARLLLSVTPFARWDLVRKTVSVNVAGSTTEYRSYDAGGSTIGVVAGIGLEL